MWFTIASAFILTPPDPGVEFLPGWMAGCWEEVSGRAWTEECWIEPRGGMMLGTSRKGSGQRAESFEYMSLDGRLGETEFCALPSGREGTCFEKAKETPTEIVFVNVTHDYPQRVRYWREGKYLNAEVSLADGSKAQRWRYAPKGD